MKVDCRGRTIYNEEVCTVHVAHDCAMKRRERRDAIVGWAFAWTITAFLVHLALTGRII